VRGSREIVLKPFTTITAPATTPTGVMEDIMTIPPKMAAPATTTSTAEMM
jgi:hypothetical protein